MENIKYNHGGNIYAIKRKYKRDIIDFSANINPLGLPKAVRRVIRNNVDNVSHYPDPQSKDLVEMIAQYWHIRKDNILLGNGSVELIYLLMNSLKPNSVSIPVPSFSEYERAAGCVTDNIKFIRLEEKECFKLDFSVIPKTELLILANPNNPTGNLLFEDFNTLLKCFTNRIVVDEAFMDWLPEEKNISIITKAVKTKRIIVLRTFTKFFAIPGLRIGYLIAHQEVIKFLKKFQAPWNCNVLSQLAACEAIKDEIYIEKSRQDLQGEKKFFLKNIKLFPGLKIYPTKANFFLAKIINKDITSTFLQKALIKEGILVRDCLNFRGFNDKFIRFAVRSRKENKCLCSALKRVLGKKK